MTNVMQQNKGQGVSVKFWIELSSREQETVSTLTEKTFIDYP